MRGHQEPRHRDEALVEGINGKPQLLQGYSTQDWFSAFITKDNEGHLLIAIYLDPSSAYIVLYLLPIGQAKSTLGMSNHAELSKD